MQQRHDAQAGALRSVAQAIPVDWRRGSVERHDLARFLFAPEDIVVAVGQDGLVANVAKYLDGQPVISVNDDPARNPGVLALHPPGAVAALLAATAAGTPIVQPRAMVQATLDDGQTLVALNECYVGHASHQSARYELRLSDGRAELQSSSGLLVGTGTGATGWCRSVWQERRCGFALPGPADQTLAWFVREAWPSPGTGTALTAGVLTNDALSVVSRHDELVVFGDGIESDHIELSWGQQVTVGCADRQLTLVTGPA